MVQGNQDALERIFANMLQNAGRYAYSYLNIHMEKNGSRHMKVCFQNDSREITEGDIPYLFERFYKNDLSRSKGSSGLGLTIAKSLAEAMGGSLTAQALPHTEYSSDSRTADDAKTTISFILTLIADDTLSFP